MEQVVEQKAIAQRSAEAEILIKLLEKAEVGQVVTYLEMREACKTATFEEIYGQSMTARRFLRKHRSMVFDPVRGIGLKRCNSSEMLDVVDARRKRAKTQGREAMRDIRCVEYDRLSDAEKKRHNLKMAELITLNLLMKPSTSANLTQVVVNSNGPPTDAKKLLEFLAK